MTLQELKDAADDLINYSRFNRAKLVAALIYANSTEANAKAIDKRILEQVIDLFNDSYDDSGLIEWLVEHDFNPLDGIEWANELNKVDYTDEEWQEILDKGDYLFISEDNDWVVESW